MSDMSIEGTAGVCQQKGKELYTCGNYAGAVAAYSEGLQQLKRLGSAANVARSTLLGNRAACHLALGDATAAEADCKAGLAQAASPKLYYRLAKALMDPSRQNLDAAGAAAAMAAAVALLQPPVCQCSMSEEMTRLYTKLESLTHASGFQGPELPHNPSSICHAACTQTLCYALSTGAEFIVLNPGSYRLPAQLSAAGGFTLLGIGSVQLLSEVSHALWLQQGTITLVNVQLAGSGQHAAVCVTTPTTSFFPMCGAASSSCVAPRLRMIDCRVINYSEAGLLVCGGHAFLIRCSFKNCRLQAVEVREGGSLTAHQTVVDHCLQGELRAADVAGNQMSTSAPYMAMHQGERVEWWGYCHSIRDSCINSCMSMSIIWCRGMVLPNGQLPENGASSNTYDFCLWRKQQIHRQKMPKLPCC
jgi:hypothetical protein